LDNTSKACKEDSLKLDYLQPLKLCDPVVNGRRGFVYKLVLCVSWLVGLRENGYTGRGETFGIGRQWLWDQIRLRHRSWTKK